MAGIHRIPGIGLTLLFLGCGGTPTSSGNPPPPTCTSPVTVALAVGQYQFYDPVQGESCLQLPGAATAQEYLVVEYAGAGNVTTFGTTTPYAFVSGAVGSALQGASLADELPVARLQATATPAQFDGMLRRRDREASVNPLVRMAASRVPMPVPVVGDRDSFNVCSTLNCTAFKRVGATVKYVGSPAIIYLDDRVVAGAETFTQSDLDGLGSLFDGYLYKTDTTAFGPPSDINVDQHIAILISPSINDLTPDCSQGRIIGYFFGNDLLASSQGSNHREIFYAFAPFPATPNCTVVTRAKALGALPPTLIHEMQHMISFNQHVLLRPGYDQDTWANEGLSHVAEELGYRTVPDALCPVLSTCFSEFTSGDVYNAYQYLSDPAARFLVWPDTATGDLPSRGAAWLFLRWAMDHFSTDSIMGTSFTRGMEMTTTLGSAEISAQAGIPFATLVGEWQMAVYLDDLPGFAQTGRLRYRSWNLRSLFAANYPSEFLKPYPLTPDSTAAGYQIEGTLRAGSGHHVRYQLPAGSPGALVRFSATVATGGQLNTSAIPRFAVVRIK